MSWIRPRADTLSWVRPRNRAISFHCAQAVPRPDGVVRALLELTTYADDFMQLIVWKPAHVTIGLIYANGPSQPRISATARHAASLPDWIKGRVSLDLQSAVFCVCYSANSASSARVAACPSLTWQASPNRLIPKVRTVRVDFLASDKGSAVAAVWTWRLRELR